MKTCWAVSAVAAACLVAPAEGAKLKVPANYATIQAAVNAAVTGDVIEVSKGVYAEHVTITSRDHLTLRAKKGDAVYIDAAGSGIPLSITQSHYITVQDIRLRHTADSVGLNIDQSSPIRVKRCTVDDAAVAGIAIVQSGGVVIEDCLVKNSGGDGIELFAASSVVRDTTVRDAGANGISVVGFANTLEGNRVEGGGSAGIKLGGLMACESCLVVDNRVEGAWDGILLADNAEGNTVLENTIVDTDRDGIELLDGAESSVITGNTMKGIGANGMKLDSAYCLHSKNDIKDTAEHGVFIGANADACLFYKNKVTKAGTDGFQVNGVGNALTENLAKQSGGYDLNDNTAPGSNVLLGNKFGTVAP